LLDGLNDCAAQGRLNEALEGLSARELARLLADWEFVARRDQWPPPFAANDAPWRTWLILGGRGAGNPRPRRRAQRIRVLRDPYSAKPYVLFYTTKRVGGGVQNFEAIKLLKFAAS
jgi:hypothetical protein